MSIRQGGFLTLVLTVFIILIAVLITVASRFIVSSSLNLANQFQGAQAYYLAQGSLEHGMRAYELNTAYTGDSGNISGVDYQTSVFSTDFSGLALASNRKRIRGTGVMGTSTRIVEAIVQTSNIISGGDFDGTNCGILAPWTITTTSDAPAPAYCGLNQGNPGNALLVADSSGGNSQTLATQTITSIATSGTTVFTVNYQYRIPTYSGNNETEVRFCFNTTSFCSAWQVYTATVSAWTNDSTTISISGNRTLTNFRIDMRANGNGNKTFLIDNVSLGSGSSTGLTLLAYREAVS